MVQGDDETVSPVNSGALSRTEDESALHLFAQCHEARRAYDVVGLSVPHAIGNVFTDWFFSCFDALTDEMIPKFIMICWGIWSSRNACVWNGENFDLLLMARQALLFLDNWLAVVDSSTMPTPTSSAIRWEPPHYGRLKLHTDAALDGNNGVMGFGWVLRDHNGIFLAAKNMCMHGLYGVKEAEATSMREALSWLKDTGMGDVDVETDSQLVFKAIFSPTFNSAFGLIIGDIKELASSLGGVDFRFVKRSANHAAHIVAREAVSESGCGEWFDNPPLFLGDCLMI
ncbi:uncharacterized protein LOC116020496 [Ipomoea triloba]|uniref:uncharacterized protein LOC116020496 n=1 Tax=Ipomoea triloba TaxID=35885 RepID=UPI00125E8D0D|nr:uncharacterized protein LOC116020496 [Ipomoea triloba]